MRINKKYLSEVKTKLVTYLSPWQRNEDKESAPLTDPEKYVKFFRKKIKVFHYYEPGKWNFFIQLRDESKGDISSNRIFWYDYNFQPDKSMSEEAKKYNAKFRSVKLLKKDSIVWPKHYTPAEVLEFFEKKTDSQKVKILKEALKRMEDRGGSYDYVIASAMNFYYTDDYNEPTYCKAKD